MRQTAAVAILVLALAGCVGPTDTPSVGSPQPTASGVEWYTPMPQTLSEREKNRWACEQIVFLNQAVLDILDEAVATDQDINLDRLIQDYIDSYRALGIDLQTPFGEYLVTHASAMEEEYFNPDQTNYEATAALGSAFNSGEAIDPASGSLFDRCSRLGVELGQ